MFEKAENGQKNVYRTNSEAEFDIHVFLKDGIANSYVLYASDGRPFIVKYGKPLIKDGKLSSFVISLVDPSVSKKDIAHPSYISETFSHFFGRNIDPSEDISGIDDGGLLVAEIALGAAENGLFFLIDDLNYKHIDEVILSKYYGSHQGQYDYIGRTMVGIAGRILKDFYGVEFLAVKTDKTKGFYWEISGHPPEKPDIRMITKHLERIKDVKIRREIRQNLYMSIIKKIITRRFDPYWSAGVGDINIEHDWEIHCSEINSIFSDYKPSLRRLLSESKDIVTAKGVEEFINQMMMDYKAENIEWFSSISNRMHRLLEAQQAGDKEQRDSIIDELMSIEGDPIVKNWLNNFKQYEITIDFISMIKEMLSQLSGIFPIFNLSKIHEVKIVIEAVQERPCSVE